MANKSLAALFDTALVSTAFETQEIAIDPVVLGDLLRLTLNSETRINQQMSSDVSTVLEARSGYVLTGKNSGDRFSETYTAVINATWKQRLAIDSVMGLQTSRPVVHRFSEAEKTDIVFHSLQNLRQLMPGASSSLDENQGWEVAGGYITAWGSTGIEDPKSELHERYRVGVHSRGNYHSIDTGKLTLAPLFAAEACARILQQWA